MSGALVCWKSWELAWCSDELVYALRGANRAQAFGIDALSINWGWRLSIRKVSIRQIKAGRALVAWSQDDLARHSKVGIATVKRLEAEDAEAGGRISTWEALVAALEAIGVEFLTENEGGIGVRLAARPRTAKPTSRQQKSR